MGFDRMGATADSMRLRNNDWFIARSKDGTRDIPIFRLNEQDKIEFFSAPLVNGQPIGAGDLESRVEALEALIGSMAGSSVNVYNLKVSMANIIAKGLNLPHAPQAGKIVMLPSIGVPQIVDEDFQVTGSQLSWAGHDLETQIVEDDIFIIIYMY